jgi:membrane peptidoglycan carboxypeptidase
MLEALPRGLAPLLASMHMTGTLSAKGALEYDGLHPGNTQVRLAVTNDCRIDQMSADVSPRRFGSAFQREVKGADRLPMRIESGPGSATWVPYEEISPFMETAVLVCEDGHFPRHRGFDYEAIANAVRDNLIAKRFVRGASTISMQLAKNLYLDGGKTLGRKVQEAALTLLLEQELDKRALMELYLNVIEYGPGIYGIGPATDYYFAKKPQDLSLGQALYIASILPNPDRQHFRPDGRVSDGWTKYLQRLMGIARKIKRITPEQLESGLQEQLAFRVADSGAVAPPVSNPSGDDAGEQPPLDTP